MVAHFLRDTNVGGGVAESVPRVDLPEQGTPTRKPSAKQVACARRRLLGGSEFRGILPDVD
jgi:hypothetical protein